MANRLGSEKSPYLLQHKDNPIHWYAWGQEAFEAAKSQNKPVFLSVGYSTCHWCHVMAHESFEDQEVADALNTGFIAIKVDREERPDVDDLYMKALQTLSGGGGWPMSAWLTPEGKPFYAGTYFPKYRFLQLLRRIGEIWNKEHETLKRDADQMIQVLGATAERDEETDADEAARLRFLSAYTNHFQYSFDEVNGGFGGAPKFPQTMNLMMMMRQDRKTGLNQAENMVSTTLQHMLRGGMYDHLMGGFHRYSVDAEWMVPHFEKMLYDQALISLTLLDARALYKEPEFERAARETLDYVLSEMTHPQGGFYAAQDADSLNPSSGHSEEGYFATYSYGELKETLTAEELTVLEKFYGVTPAGNFEGRNILHLQEGFDGATARQDPAVQSAWPKLRKLRASRPAPHLDDKIISAWNGWMIWAFARAGAQFGDSRYSGAAAKALTFVRQNLWRDGRLSRFWRDGEARAAATGEDYASLILAAMEVSQTQPDPQLVTWILQMQNILDADFWDESDGRYYTSDGRDPLLPLRTKDEYDGVTPGINSMCSYNLERLFHLTGDARMRMRARRIQATLFPVLKRYPSGLPFLALAMDWGSSKPRVAVHAAQSWPLELKARALKTFNPYILWAQAGSGWPVADGKTENAVYVCEEGSCLRPALSPDEAKNQLGLS